MLQVKPNVPLTDVLLRLIGALDQVAKQLKISYFVIGATARDILMEHVYELEAARATRDVDFAVAVSSWGEFDRLKAQLIATAGFFPGEHAHRLTFGEGIGAYPLDLVPFDGVEQGGEIAWPPKGEFVMNVSGYVEAFHSALDVEIAPGFKTKVVSLPAMAILKILAWSDRPEGDKHASDVLLILRNYHQAGQFDRLYAECMDLLEAHVYDVELSGAALLGRDAQRDITQETRDQVIAVFANQKNFEKFNSQMMKSHTGDVERTTLLLNGFLQELNRY
ncbi:nucleotidyl transferase AbiEii/AbiGii toxin family protein [Janthinobacterium sp. 64]|uniref:nucleotidyl transferase AbiEii/AbiGii toxin family protein n=1 Tax=Janthinobacterium sp. 64 TaxID=2035208 RepID=UPI000C2BCDBD|nr:nucleotidyl transferase AbiEii/AbiGii toxin family protein [Janthinobacterium sp. 64]PKB13766.1 putative nucleotidyltransferase [Janthinobacterium sp. 64]